MAKLVAFRPEASQGKLRAVIGSVARRAPAGKSPPATSHKGLAQPVSSFDEMAAAVRHTASRIVVERDGTAINMMVESTHADLNGGELSQHGDGGRRLACAPACSHAATFRSPATPTVEVGKALASPTKVGAPGAGDRAWRARDRGAVGAGTSAATLFNGGPWAPGLSPALNLIPGR